MPQDFRLALIGAGLITESAHLPAALASTRVTVEAIVDPVADRAVALAHKFGIRPRIVTDIGAVAQDIDGAVIATPNHTHKEIALRCLDAGIPVLVEKPLASTRADGLAVVSATERAGKVLAVGYCSRFRRNVTLLKELLDGAFFGRVRSFYHQFGTAGGWAPASGYILNRESVGGGVLVITGTHFLDRMLNFWGYPDGVRLADDSAGGPEANAVASFRYDREGGEPMEGKARYSKTTALPGGLVLDTDAGIVTVADTDEAEIVLRPRSRPELREVIGDGSKQPDQDVFLLQLEDFVAACREGRAPRVTGREGLESLRLLAELYGNRVQLIDRWYGRTEEASWASA